MSFIVSIWNLRTLVLYASIFPYLNSIFPYSLFSLSVHPIVVFNSIFFFVVAALVYFIFLWFFLCSFWATLNYISTPSASLSSFFLILCSSLNALINSLRYFEFMAMILAKIFICLLAIFSPRDYGFVLLFVFPISFFLKH